MRYCVCTILMTCVVLAPSAGAGQSAPSASTEAQGAPTPPGYTEAVDRAVDEFERGNFAEARASLREAHALYPNARTLRGLGKAEYELKNYRACIAYLEQALVSSERPLDDGLRADADRLLRTARSYVGRYRIELEPVQQGNITLDGRSLELSDGDTFVVEVGDHWLEVQAPGYRVERRELRVTGGTEEVLRVKLRELPRSESGVQRKRRIWAFSLASVALLGVATGLAVALTRDETVAAPDAGNADVWGTISAMQGTALRSW